MRMEVQDYSTEWIRMFEAEAEKIRGIFGREIIDIHHIGSTSVPGLKAKPIIDMMPVVKEIEAVDAFNRQMEELGYRGLGEYGIPGRRYFRKGNPKRTHHVHVFGMNNSTDINRHLAVRNYLRANKAAAESYGNLKADLADRFPEDMAAYIAGKNAFVKALEKVGRKQME
ncbi:GrpB family protein [Salinicoccus sesuvii]